MTVIDWITDLRSLELKVITLNERCEEEGRESDL